MTNHDLRWMKEIEDELQIFKGRTMTEKMEHRRAGGTFARARDGLTREGRWRDGAYRFE